MKKLSVRSTETTEYIKVIVGGKVHPNIKKRLIQEAAKLGITVSELVDTILTNWCTPVLYQIPNMGFLEEKEIYIPQKVNILSETQQEVVNNTKLELSRLKDKLLTELEQVAAEKEKYMQMNKQIDIYKRKFDFLHIEIMEDYIPKSMLEAVYGQIFNKDQVYVDGYHFRKNGLNPNKYAISKIDVASKLNV